jgi:hypothetical protein
VPKMDEKNALDYIRSASFYTSEKYQWIRPIIDAVLNDTFDDSSAFNFVNSLYEGLERQSARKNHPENPQKRQRMILFAFKKFFPSIRLKTLGL